MFNLVYRPSDGFKGLVVGLRTGHSRTQDFIDSGDLDRLDQSVHLRIGLSVFDGGDSSFNLFIHRTRQRGLWQLILL